MISRPGIPSQEVGKVDAKGWQVFVKEPFISPALECGDMGGRANWGNLKKTVGYPKKENDTLSRTTNFVDFRAIPLSYSPFLLSYLFLFSSLSLSLCVFNSVRSFSLILSPHSTPTHLAATLVRDGA